MKPLRLLTRSEQSGPCPSREDGQNTEQASWRGSELVPLLGGGVAGRIMLLIITNAMCQALCYVLTVNDFPNCCNNLFYHSGN